MCGPCGYFREWAKEFKARKFIPQQASTTSKQGN